jgi:hypothetical protein
MNHPQNSMPFFTEIEKNPKIYMKVQKPRIYKAFINKKYNAGSMTIPDFKLYYRSIATKRSDTDRKIDNYDR